MPASSAPRSSRRSDDFAAVIPSPGRPSANEEHTMQRESTPIGAPSWIDVMSSDIAATRSFYCELFGWSGTEPNVEFGGYVNFSNTGGLIAGGMSKDDANPMPDVWSVYIAVTDAAATTELVKAHGGQVIFEPMA